MSANEENKTGASKETFHLGAKKLAVPAAVAAEWSFERRPGGWVIATRATDQGIERKRFFLDESKGSLSFSIDGFLSFGSVRKRTRAGAASGGSDQDLVAQFPGKVRKVLVAEGDRVEEGAPLLLLEAMKMEFSAKAPFAGVIEKIRVSEGQQLSPGDRFLDMKPTDGK
jgi:biotin carboxyl carrier protein